MYDVPGLTAGAEACAEACVHSGNGDRLNLIHYEVGWQKSPLKWLI